MCRHRTATHRFQRWQDRETVADIYNFVIFFELRSSKLGFTVGSDTENRGRTCYLRRSNLESKNVSLERTTRVKSCSPKKPSVMCAPKKLRFGPRTGWYCTHPIGNLFFSFQTSARLALELHIARNLKNNHAKTRRTDGVRAATKGFWIFLFAIFFDALVPLVVNIMRSAIFQ